MLHGRVRLERRRQLVLRDRQRDRRAAGGEVGGCELDPARAFLRELEGDQASAGDTRGGWGLGRPKASCNDYSQYLYYLYL